MATGGNNELETMPGLRDLVGVCEMLEEETTLHAAVKRNNHKLCRKLLDCDPSQVISKNSNGETPLHLATKDETDPAITKMILGKDSDINAPNKWGQTPLHYAAYYRSLDKIEILLSIKEIEIKQDMNGYNPLHCFVFASENENASWRKGVKAFVRAGIDINCQTNFGQHILHLASNKFENINFLRFLLREFTEIRVDRANEDNENVLHAFVMYGLDPDANGFFEEFMEGQFSACSRDQFFTLLNQKDVYGQTPFSMLLDSPELSRKVLEKMITLGACVNVTDNLGHTPLHRMVALSLRTCKNVVESLVEAQADVNACNIYGQCVASFIHTETPLETLLYKGTNFNIADRWGQTPLMSLFKHESVSPEIIRKFIEGGAKVDVKDIEGAVALHYAAFNDNFKGAELLISHGADLKVTDSLGETAIETAKRMYNMGCEKTLIKASDQKEVIYQRYKNFKDLLRDIPDTVKLSDLTKAPDIRGLLGLPEQVESFLQELLKVKLTGSYNRASEDFFLLTSIRKLVESICKQVETYDSRFKISVIPTGSSVEGTKIGTPDEFDFLLCLDKWSDICAVVPTTDRRYGFASLKYDKEETDELYKPFFDGDGLFVPYYVLHLLFRYIKRALNEPDLWKTGKLSYKFEDDLRDYTSKPVFHFKVFWNGVRYKSLLIGIDLALAVRTKGEWPADIIPRKLPLMDVNLQDQEYLLLLQTHLSDDSHLMICGMDDCINFIEDAGADDERTAPASARSMLRISSALPEINLIKNAPKIVRDSYALAKLLVNAVCPKITTSLRSEAACYYYGVKDVDVNVEPDREISSYMLKNCMFHVLEELGWNPEKSESDCLRNLSLIQMTTKIFEQLQTFCSESHLPAYFMPDLNVLDFEMTDIQITSGYHFLCYVLIRRRRREMCIKLILCILRGDNVIKIAEIPDIDSILNKIKLDEKDDSGNPILQDLEHYIDIGM